MLCRSGCSSCASGRLIETPRRSRGQSRAISIAAVPATLTESERPRPVRSASGTKVSGETGRVRPVPAGQRLHHHRAAVGQPHHGLVMHADLAAGEAVAQRGGGAIGERRSAGTRRGETGWGEPGPNGADCPGSARLASRRGRPDPAGPGHEQLGRRRTRAGVGAGGRARDSPAGPPPRCGDSPARAGSAGPRRSGPGHAPGKDACGSRAAAGDTPEECTACIPVTSQEV